MTIVLKRWTIVGILISFGLMLLVGSLAVKPIQTQSVSTSVAAVANYEEAELQLAQQINKHSKKTWNQSQTQASKIVNLVMNGHDIYTAVSAVIGIFTFGWGFAIITIAQLSLKWYIKKKGRKAAVTW